MFGKGLAPAGRIIVVSMLRLELATDERALLSFIMIRTVCAEHVVYVGKHIIIQPDAVETCVYCPIHRCRMCRELRLDGLPQLNRTQTERRLIGFDILKSIVLY